MLSEQPRVSVVIPCFNRWPHIQRAIDSVLAQSYESTECIVVDDASTDGSHASLASHYQGNSRVRLLSLNRNQGQSAARNHGARQASGELLCFLDSDDILLEDSIASRVSIFQEDPRFHGISFGSKRIADHPNLQLQLEGVKQRGETLGLNDYLADKNWLHTNTFMLPTRLFLEAGGFNERLRNQEDIELFIRLLVEHEARFCATPCCLIQSIDNQRARHDFPRIIEQGSRYTEAILGNAALMKRVSKHTAKRLAEDDVKVLLNALYKSRHGQEFRKQLRKAVRKGHCSLEPRLIKRYLLSYFLR